MASAASPYLRHRFPPEIIAHCVLLYVRFPLSFRAVEEMMLMRGVQVSYETIRRWCQKFGQQFANELRRRRPKPGDKGHLDEVFLKGVVTLTRRTWMLISRHKDIRVFSPPSQKIGVSPSLLRLPDTRRLGHLPPGVETCSHLLPVGCCSEEMPPGTDVR